MNSEPSQTRLRVEMHTDELRSEVEQSDVHYSHTESKNDDFWDVANINIVVKKKSYTLANTLKSLFSECSIWQKEKQNLSMMDNLFFFDPKIVPSQDFPGDPPKWTQNEAKKLQNRGFWWKITKFAKFEIVFSDFRTTYGVSFTGKKLVFSEL